LCIGNIDVKKTHKVVYNELKINGYPGYSNTEPQKDAIYFLLQTVLLKMILVQQESSLERISLKSAGSNFIKNLEKKISLKIKFKNFGCWFY
jgi:hypothetical protein